MLHDENKKSLQVVACKSNIFNFFNNLYSLHSTGKYFCLRVFIDF